MREFQVKTTLDTKPTFRKPEVFYITRGASDYISFNVRNYGIDDSSYPTEQGPTLLNLTLIINYLSTDRDTAGYYVRKTDAFELNTDNDNNFSYDEETGDVSYLLTSEYTKTFAPVDIDEMTKVEVVFDLLGGARQIYELPGFVVEDSLYCQLN